MSKFTAARPAHRPKATASARAPRNPYAAVCWQRPGGAHQAPHARQAAQARLKSDLRELWHPPSTD